MQKSSLTDGLRKLLARRLRVGPQWRLTARDQLLIVLAILFLGSAALWLKREATIVADGQVGIRVHDFFIHTALTPDDVVTALVLGILAGVCLIAAVLLRGWTLAPRGTSRAFAIAATAALLAALDEGLALHETAGVILAFLRGVPFVDHPDDVLMGVYVLGVLGFAWTIRHLVRPFRSAQLWIGAGVALFVLAQLGDLLPTQAFGSAEELLELLAAACLGLGFFILSVRHIGRAFVEDSELTRTFQPDEQLESDKSTSVA